METNNNPIIITIEGGIVSSVVCRDKIERDVVIIDLDTRGMDEETLSTIRLNNGGQTIAYVYTDAIMAPDEDIALFADSICI